MAINRRDFLRGSALAASAAFFGKLGIGQRGLPLIGDACAAPPSNYKALVCVFLFGGNDSNNMVLPMAADPQNANYVKYRGGTPIDAFSYAQTPLALSGTTLGLNGYMTGLPGVFAAGKMAVVLNVGTLKNTMSYPDNSPIQLFSHHDQQNQWQSADVEELLRTGWGGRVADSIYLPPPALPPLFSLDGAPLYTLGSTAQPLALTTNGPANLVDTGMNAAYLQDITTGDLSDANPMVASDASIMNLALQGNAALAADLKGVVDPTWTVPFPVKNTVNATPLGPQLAQVAHMLNAVSLGKISATRQMFFVAINGFDTHYNEATDQNTILGELDQALNAFYSATGQLGMANQVTTFTMSDFNRTFLPANGDGSDHAWGGHHLALGGAVTGGVYNVLPTLIPGGSSDVDPGDGEGRWVPTMSTDQYFATLATWFGADAHTVLPNLSTFTKAGWLPPAFL